MIGKFYIEVIDSEDNVIERRKSKNTLMDNFIHSMFTDILGKGQYVQSLDTTLTHSWDFINPQTDTFADLSGNGHYLYLDAGTLTETDGIHGDAISLDGSSDRYKFDFCNPFLADFTLEGWVRIASNITGTILQYARMEVVGHKGRAQLLINAGYPEFVTCTTVGTSFHTLTSPSLISFNKWHHVAGVHSSTLGNFLFVDGVLKVSNVAYTSLPKSLNTETSGYVGVTGTDVSSWENYFTGDIDNVALFSSAKYTSFFVPSVIPHFLNKCCGDGLYDNSNYKVTHMVLSSDSDFRSTDGNRMDDHFYYGVHNLSDDDVLIPVDVATTSTVELSDDGHQVKISALSDVLTNTGQFTSVKVLGQCDSSKTNSEHGDVTYPIISSVELDPPIGKRESTRVRVRWILQIQPN
jgi:hypothetical protein